MENRIAWEIIEKYFEENPHNLVKHHIESYNDFYKRRIYQIFREKNPITIYSKVDVKTGEYMNKVDLYFGGKTGDRIYFGKPVIYDDDDKSHYMFPNEARLRNMNYSMTIHYDVDYEVTYKVDGKNLHYFTDKGEIRGGGGDSDSDDENAIVEEYDDENPDGPAKSAYSGGALGKRRARAEKQDAKIEEINLNPTKMKEIREKTSETLSEDGTVQKKTFSLEKILLGKFPIMCQSDLCILSGVSRENRYYMGECRNDYGGYFIIDGKEKVIVPQEKFGDNMLYVQHTNDEHYLYQAKIRSVSENSAKPVRTLKVGIVTPNSSYTNRQIVVEIPNVRKPIPLFIVFRALGILSDKEIIQMCVLDLDKYEFMLDLFIPSIHDAANVMSQHAALKYISTFIKHKQVNSKHVDGVLHILSDFFLPHVGELNFREKAYHLGNIVLQLMSVYAGIHPPTDRDNFKFKRIEMTGDLLYELFLEYYNLQQKKIAERFEKKLHFNQAKYEDNLADLILENYQEIFKTFRIVETGFKKAYKGNWGASAHTKRLGIVQDLNRLSYFSALNHMRKISLPLDETSKVVGPRLLNPTQWGLIDPIDTPDGGNIGLHKHLSIMTNISQGVSRDYMIRWLKKHGELTFLGENEGCYRMSQLSKVFVNGLWIGGVEDPLLLVHKVRLWRRNAFIPIFTSVTFNIKQNTIFIYTDSGRLCRPVFYRDETSGKMSYENDSEIHGKLETGSGAYSWKELVMGFNTPAAVTENEGIYRLGHEFYEYEDIYKRPAATAKKDKDAADSSGGAAAAGNEIMTIEKFSRKKAIIDFIDTNEAENILIALNVSDLTPQHTHLELHNSLIFGLMCSMIVFPENAPATRNSFSCGQSKQAVSLYNTNYQVRMDKMGVVLNCGQIPLVKTRYLNLVNREENTYGENAIVAIMCYTGYNVEDAILINEGSVKRGIFQTTYFTMYEAHEEMAGVGGAKTNKRFANIEKEKPIRTRAGYDYSQLDEYGIVKTGTPMNDKIIVIGMTSPDPSNPEIRVDGSVKTKKGQLGIIDKTFITDNEEGQRIAKVRVVEIRTPAMGDKFASRAGQKGTIGLIIPEQDMPFTRNGQRPDMIINPHAFPTRQTINQLVECMLGKACVTMGGFGDGTAYMNRGLKYEEHGEILTRSGMHHTGTEILYNGMTGEQIESEIFIGPTYYMRLKHMVKDKINYRSRGPNAMLTRQPVQGRANDGGLRVGEMESNSIMGHGMMEFLRHSMMERSDKYHLAICNKSGMIAIYNPDKNMFFSPVVDGPLKFTGGVDIKDMRMTNITRFGRDFSVVEVPYTFKLLIQELSTINVQMRIITEDNIAQLENMMYSDNIEKITWGVMPDNIVNHTKQLLSAAEMKPTVAKPPPPSSSPQFAAIEPTATAAPFSPESPVYVIPESQPEGAVISPASVDEAAIPSPPYAPSPAEESPLFEFEKNPEKIVSFGGATAIPNLRGGDSVYYLKDRIPDRKWKIVDVDGGGDFMTIETDDNRGFKSADQAVEVVERHEVKRATEQPPIVMLGGGGVAANAIPVIAPNGQQYLLSGGGGDANTAFPSVPSAPSPPATNVNIKLFGGSDFSTAAAEPPQMPVSNYFENTPVLTKNGISPNKNISISNASTGGKQADGDVSSFFEKIPIFGGAFAKSQNNTSNKKNDEPSSSAIDAGSFVVKKIE